MGLEDADFAAELDTRRSHTGYVIMMNGGPISWKSMKHVSLSTAESQWYAVSEAGKELLYLRIIMREFGFPHWSLCTCMRTRVQLSQCQRTQIRVLTLCRIHRHAFYRC